MKNDLYYGHETDLKINLKINNNISKISFMVTSYQTMV